MAARAHPARAPLRRAVMSYLQVVCEQHRLVEQHLGKFAHPDVDEEPEEVRARVNT